ncbi:MAG: thymidylate synthase [Candidatus Peribacteraceae bacterium]|nr:thymidylate synthase [Candidatus Peribacteraceae bacterium]
MNHRRTVFMGGAGGLGKTSFGKALEDANPGRVKLLNCTEEAMRSLNVENRSDLHRFSYEEKLTAVNEGIERAMRNISDEIRLLLLDGHYAVETEPRKFEPGCYPIALQDKIDTALHLTTTPDALLSVRQLDQHRKRGLSRDQIQDELDHNETEAKTLEQTKGIPLRSIPIALQQLNTRWDMSAVFSTLQELVPELQGSDAFNGKSTSMTDRPYPVIRADNIDRLVVEGAEYILRNGRPIQSRVGDAIQAYNVTYHFDGSRDRVHVLRAPQAITYLCREFVEYFKGTLEAKEMGKASSFWLHLTDENGRINSNCGYCTFKQPIPESSGGNNQFEWVIAQLRKNPDSRKAIINFNNAEHKTPTRDFPCVVSAQFFIEQDTLNCFVSSRSTDVLFGLPYDVGYFSFLNELLLARLREHYPKLQLGSTSMHSTFTQVYDLNRQKVMALLTDVRRYHKKRTPLIMPAVESGTYDDIMNGTQKTEVARWIHEYAYGS